MVDLDATVGMFELERREFTLMTSAALMDLEALGFPVLVMSASAAALFPFPGGDRSLGPPPSALGFESPTAAPPG